ncbi:MAG: hypothetical protein WCJ30_24840 [Deltaproteobacteria bacterium]
MSNRCERCRKGYSSPLPRDDIEWPDERPEPWRPGLRELRVARCTRCDTWLLDLWTTDGEKQGVESHDVCLVRHDKARAAVLHRDPLALARVAGLIRRRHLELIVARMPTIDEVTLHRIESGVIETTDALRGLVTRVLATRGTHPSLSDVRLRSRGAARTPVRTAGLRVALDVGDGSRVLLEPRDAKLSLVRMRGDAVAWRVEIDVDAREAFVGQVEGTRRPTLVVLAAGSDGRAALVWVVRATTANRTLIAKYPELFAAAFPGSSRAWADALMSGAEPPREPGLVWASTSRRRRFTSPTSVARSRRYSLSSAPMRAS